MKEYEELCSFEILYNAYLKARKGRRGKTQEASYEANVLDNTRRLSERLLSETYRPGPFHTFLVWEPKERIVQAPIFSDKVVQNAFVDNYLYEVITRSFVDANGASQTGKGTHYTLDGLKSDMIGFWRRTGSADGWVLKCDIRHFFASIDHGILKGKLKARIADERIYRLVEYYIDASPAGLPLGYRTSQLFALLYLDGMDHFIKERLRIKGYRRYMDDFVLIHEDKGYLQYCRDEITDYLKGLRLELNEKTHIFPIKNGVDFLGFHTYMTESGKIIRKLRHSSVKRMNERIRHWRKEYPEGKTTKEKILERFRAWDAHAAHGDTHALRGRMAARVAEIIGQPVKIRKPIRTCGKKGGMKQDTWKPAVPSAWDDEADEFWWNYVLGEFD